MRKSVIFMFLILGVLSFSGCSTSNQSDNVNNESLDASTGSESYFTGENSDKVSVENLSTGSVSIDTGKLADIEIESTWSESKQEEYRQQLENWTGGVAETETEAVNKARFYKNMGEVGNAIMVYRNYLNLSGNELSFPVTSNLGNLYADICVVDGLVNPKYCKKAIEYFKIMIQRYQKDRYYEDIIRVLLDMGQKDLAERMYETYRGKGGTENLDFEKRFNN